MEQANAATRPGGPDIEGYCGLKYPAQGGNDVAMAKASLKYHAADGWRCYQVAVESYPTGGWLYTRYEHVIDYAEYKIDLNDACRQQYGSRAWASAGSSSNPSSWFCYI